MTGLAPYTAWIRRLDDGTGWIARVEVRRVADGTTIAAAEQVCTRAESKWAKADDHALAGMAQTRATSRALRGPLMQVVELAGYTPTPAEEMPVDESVTDAEVVEHPTGKIPEPNRPTPQQTARIGELLRQLGEFDPDTDWKSQAREIAGCPGNMLTATVAAMLIDRLTPELEKRQPSPKASAA